MAISLLAYVATFSGQLYLWRSCFFKLLQSNYFDTIATFLEWQFLQSSRFFRGAPFLKQSLHRSSYFFQNSYLSQSETSVEQALLQNRKFFTAVTFWNSYIFGRGIVYNNDIYRGATFSKQVLLQFQKNYILEKANFSEKQYSALPISSGKLPF